MNDDQRPPQTLDQAKRTALAYVAWADELLDHLRELREETTDRQLRSMLVDAGEHASRSWMSARSLARHLDQLEQYSTDREQWDQEP